VDEHEAIRRLKQHDLRGLESLVHDHQLEAVRVAMLVTRDRALAEDVVQSSFVRVCEKIGQFDEGRPFRPWFLRIVTNAALKGVTRGRRDISYEMLALRRPVRARDCSPPTIHKSRPSGANAPPCCAQPLTASA